VAQEEWEEPKGGRQLDVVQRLESVEHIVQAGVSMVVEQERQELGDRQRLAVVEVMGQEEWWMPKIGGHLGVVQRLESVEHNVQAGVSKLVERERRELGGNQRRAIVGVKGQVGRSCLTAES